MAQGDFDNFLTQIVKESQEDLQTIIIFNLSDGLPFFSNKQLKEKNFSLYKALYSNEEGAEETGLNYLQNIQDALNNFGKVTDSGGLQYSIFKLDKSTMIIYYHQLPDVDVAICFLASEQVNLGNVVFLARRRIGEIRAKLDNL